VGRLNSWVTGGLEITSRAGSSMRLVRLKPQVPARPVQVPRKFTK